MGRWLLIPALIVVVAGGGILICTMLGISPLPTEMAVAAGVCLVVSGVALVPLYLTRGATQFGVAQAGLVATMIHLFGCAAIGGSLIMLKPINVNLGIVYWLLAFYWATLIGLVWILIRAIRQAPVEPVPKQK